ncbi:MAG: hypothetical protein JSU06_00315 [Actinobacteria bacterium]|nr:hypothetical protein [Actinomycetota bacterium]
MDSPAGRLAADLRRLRAEAGVDQEEPAFKAGLHRTRTSLRRCRMAR